MKRMFLILCFAFLFSFCCACNAVTPGPSTTRSTAAAVAVVPATEISETHETVLEPTTAAPVTEIAPELSTEAETTEGKEMRATIELNIRDGAGTDSNVIGSLEEGETILCVGSEGKWAIVIYHGEKCYASERYLEAVE